MVMDSQLQFDAIAFKKGPNEIIKNRGGNDEYILDENVTVVFQGMVSCEILFTVE